MLCDEKKRKDYDSDRLAYDSYTNPFDLFNDLFKDSTDFMHQSTNSSLVNGKKVTHVSMFKNNKHIDEIYEDDVLVERKTNGLCSFNLKTI